MPFFVKALSIAELKRSNVLLTGTNQQGKSRLAMAISETLHNQGILDNWRVLVFDVVGHWKRLSSVSNYIEIRELKRVKVPEQSVIFDISYLLPSEQKQFIESTLLNLWNSSLDSNPQKHTLLIFEESQLIARRARFSEQLMRIASVGANYKIRCMFICPSLTMIDTELIRLCNQRMHFRLGCESNIKKKFRSYYGLDNCRVALNLDVGFFLYYLDGKLEVKHVNLYESETKPQSLHLVKPEPKIQPISYTKPKQKGFFARLFAPLPQSSPYTRPIRESKFVRPVNPEPEQDEELDQDLDYFCLVEDI